MGKNISRIACIVILLYAFSFKAFSQNRDIETIKENFREIYVSNGEKSAALMEVLKKDPPGEDASDRVIVELQQRVPYESSTIENYLKNLNEKGAWSDINYKDKTRSGWEPRIHAERILELTKLYINSETPYFKSSEIENAIHKAMNYWFESRLTCPNWWYNQIGIPRTMGTAFVLFEPYMTADEKSKAIELMKNSKLGMTGQNKVWLAGNVMIRGLLEDNIELVRTARNEIVSEIRTGGKEGIKDDWCFHQHGPQQQFGNYGLAFVTTMSLFSGLLSDTSLEFSEEQLNVIASLIDNGYRWIIWKGKMDISAMGRQLFEDAQIHKALSMAFAVTELGGSDDENCRNTEDGFLKACFIGKKNKKYNGTKHFWQSDYTVARRKEWSATLKMASTRVMGTECMNGDNMKGYYMADGALFIYKSGEEYLNIFPVWDWRKIPGTTCYQDDAEVPVLKNSYYPGNSGKFVGGLTDEGCGVSVMHLDRDGLEARKLWLFTEDAIVCLGAGISSDSTLEVATTLEQCWSRGNLEELNNGKWTRIDGERNISGKEIRLIHDGKGYILRNPEGIRCEVSDMKSTGDWHEIMQTCPTEKVEGKVATICINHGIRPNDANYEAIIIPDADKKCVEKFDADKFYVIENNEKLQAIADKANGTLWIASLTENQKFEYQGFDIDIKTPAIYRIKLSGKKADIKCSDPSQEQSYAEIKVNGNAARIELPQGKYKGRNSNSFEIKI